MALGYLTLGFCPSLTAQGQRSSKAGAPSKSHEVGPAFPVLLVSDIHFDPLHDPGKAKQLVSAPLSQWKSIFDSPPSPDQASAFAALQSQCGAKGIDTPPALLNSALAAMKSRQPYAKFMLVSGDLVVHDFPCRYKALMPDSSPAEYQAFVLKTISYVAHRLRSTFPGMPVYAALGNNDSGCQDYRLDSNSEFLAKAGEILSAGFQVAARDSMKSAFSAEGNYSVPMARPMRNTRLIVLNDTFLSTKYRTCEGKHDSKGPEGEIAWFKKELSDARRAGQRVWVMGHIPPGIDPFSTVTKFKNVCNGEDPVMFLASTEIPDVMIEYADIIKLGVFAHTHMDEMRLLRKQGDENTADAAKVAIKMISSISPVHGNNPSFTIATVDPESATLKDYTIFEGLKPDSASEKSGEFNWIPECNYARAYHQQDFSGAALKTIIEEFQSDRQARLPESQTYIRSYFVGDHLRELTPFWMQYNCALNNYTGEGYAACVCHNGN